MIRQASINVLHDLICDVHEEYQIELSQVLKEARERLKFKPRIVELAQVKQTRPDTALNYFSEKIKN